MKSIQIHIRGLVQGVFFRLEAKRKAEEFNIKGFVKNEPDGSVLVEAEGEEDTLEKFKMWCKTGPKNARVTSIEVKQMQPKKFSDFEIF